MYTELTLDESQNIVGGAFLLELLGLDENCDYAFLFDISTGEIFGYYDYCKQECVAL